MSSKLLTANFSARKSLFVKNKIITTCDQNIAFAFHQHMHEYNANAQQ